MTIKEPTECRTPRRGNSIRLGAIGLFAGILTAGAGGAVMATGAAAVTSADSAAAAPGWKPAQAPVPTTAAANAVATVRQGTCTAPGKCVGVASFNSKSGFAAGLIEQLQ